VLENDGKQILGTSGNSVFPTWPCVYLESQDHPKVDGLSAGNPGRVP